MENTKGKEKVNEKVPENVSVELSRDLQMEIMSWLPKKSLMRFSCVSKSWSSSMRDEKFKKVHYERSSKIPKVLFVFTSRKKSDILFHSVYQEELSSGQKEMYGQPLMRITNHEPLHQISAPIRGLLCLRLGTKVVICNPGIQKSVTLPEPKVAFRRSYFGYDKDLDVFKVLGTDYGPPGIPIGTNEFHVYTVRSGEESWRPIVCNHLNFPLTNSLCKGGVIYYGAWGRPNNKGILMSFNVKSEEFNVIELPREVKIEIGAKLVNYNGYIALVNPSWNKLYRIGAIQMLVRNDDTGEWRSQLFGIPRWRETVGDLRFSFEGTVGTGELVFTEIGLLNGKSFPVVYYNTNTKKIKKINIDGGAEGGSYDFVHTFLNHVDTSLLK